MDRVARRSPLARAPGALKSHNAEKLKPGETKESPLSIFSGTARHFFRIFFFEIFFPKGSPLHFFDVLRQNGCWKIPKGPFEVFQHPFCRKTWKNWRKKIFFFSGENLTMPKKLKGGTFWDFPTSILSQNIKKMQGGPFEEKKFRKKFRKKMSRSEEKNWKGGLFGLARYDMLRGKTGKTILVHFARPIGAIWHHNIL